MLQTEYVRSLNCNYERILLEKRPEDKRYQYCILGRGGIKGLLACSLRYINGEAYLYYDISSRQNVSQLYGNRQITREWMRDFMWSLKKIQQELERFLLDICNVIWYPEQIFQDLENNIFSFLYVPYYEGETSFIKLVEFWVEHIDYNDEALVNCVYHIYEQVEKNGEGYLLSQIFEDTACLEKAREQDVAGNAENIKAEEIAAERSESEKDMNDENKVASQENVALYAGKEQKTSDKKGFLGIFDGRKTRNKKARDDYRQAMQRTMISYAAEESPYEEEEYGRTIFVEEKTEDVPQTHKLYTPEGKVLASIERPVLSIGKKKGEVDVVLEDTSVSRIHARITMEKENIYLEDLNSTNGTFKNGLRLQPYEKRRLEEEDEIKCGKVNLVFR